MRIGADTVRELAELARLRLSPEEAERMRSDLDAILAYVELLDEVDTDDVPPTTHVFELATPLREDRVAGVLPVEEALRNSPSHDAASIIVPKVIE